MCSTSIFSCVMTMISNFRIFFFFQIFIFKFFFTNIIDFCIFIWFLCFFINNFIFFLLKLIIFIVCSLKNSQNFFMQSLPLYTSCLFSYASKEKYCRHWKVWWNMFAYFVVDKFSGLFLNISIFSILHSRSAQIINGALSDF